MTSFINGRRITTKRHLENESKYLEVEEDGKTVSIHVNGISVYNRDNNEATGNEWNYKSDNYKWHQCPQNWRLWTCERRRWANEWRLWAEKWRNWAEECRGWAEKGHHQEDKGCSKARARNYQRGIHYSKVNKEHSKSDKGCPRPVSMPEEGKPNQNQGPCKTNKGKPWPEEKLTGPEEGYFVFPKPGEKKSGVDETYVRKNKKQRRPEVGYPVSDKGNPELSKPGEGHAGQDVRTNKEQPKPDEGCSQVDKEHYEFQGPDQETCPQKKSTPVHTESPRKQKMASGCNSQDENKKAPVGRHDQQSEENNPQTMKNEGLLGKNEQKNVKLEPQNENGESTMRSEQEKRTELHDRKKKGSTHFKQDPKPQLPTYGAKGPPLKRKESPVRVRKPCAKWTKSQIRRKKLHSRRNTSQAGQNAMFDEHSKAGVEWNGPCTKSKEVASERKKVLVDCKEGPSRKKYPLAPLQELSLLAKKGLLRRKLHFLPSETRDEKHSFITETNLPLDASSQQKGRLIKLPRDTSNLPGIRGQKLQANKLPNLIH